VLDGVACIYVKIVGFVSENTTKASEQKEGCIRGLRKAVVNQCASRSNDEEVYSSACQKPVSR
jgi:hypothetical protein